MKSPKGVQRCPSLPPLSLRQICSLFLPSSHLPLLAAFLRPAVINISRERRLVRLGSIAPLMFRHAWPPCQSNLPTHPTLPSALAGREGDSKSHYGGIKAERGGGWVRGGIGKQKLCFDTVKLTPSAPSFPPLLQEPCFGRRQHPRKWMNGLFVRWRLRTIAFNRVGPTGHVYSR